MKRAFFQTSDSTALLLIRVMLAVVIFPHGAQKLTGWFGGYGFSGMMNYFTGTMHLPAPIAFLTIMAEFFGPLLLLAGFATRVASASLFIVFLGVLFTTNIQHGFFMNWFGNQPGEGMEFSLLVLAMTGALTVAGAGKASLDGLIGARLSLPAQKGRQSVRPMPAGF